MCTYHDVVHVIMQTDDEDQRIPLIFDGNRSSFTIKSIIPTEIIQFVFPYAVKSVTGDIENYRKHDRYCHKVEVVLPATVTRKSSSEFNVQRHKSLNR